MATPQGKALKKVGAMDGVSRSVAIARNRHEKRGGTFIDSGVPTAKERAKMIADETKYPHAMKNIRDVKENYKRYGGK